MSQINSVYAQTQSLFTHTNDIGNAGKIGGHETTFVRDANSILQDAAEELTFTLDRSSDLSLRERKERGRDRSRLEKAKEYYEKLQAEEASPADQKAKEEKFDAFVRNEPDPNSLLNETLRHWEFPEEAWANLNQAYERAVERGESAEVLADLTEAVQLLEQRYGGAIRAGLAGALVQNTQLEESARDRGETYRTAVFDCGTTLELYEHLMKTHEEDFSQTIDFLEKALALDLADATPSKDREALYTFGHGLGRLQLLRSADENLRPLATESLPHNKLLGRVLNLGNSSYPSSADCELIARDAGKEDLVDRILFLQGMLTSVRSFPPNLFDTDDGRVKVIDATQQAVDKAVEEEDQLYA